MQTPEEFLESNGFVSSKLDRSALTDAFLKEMEAGLEGRESSLAMIPAYLSPYGEVEKDTPVTVLDAGGTNLRGAVIAIKSDGTFEIARKEREEMPGFSKEVDNDTFYKTFAAHCIRLEKHAASKAIGFCFSYPAEAAPDGDNRLICWTKEIKAPGVVGQWVGKEFRKYLPSQPSRLVLLNDTVATLLAGKATEKEVRYSSYIGFILGTGTNVAYLEKNANIKKLKGAGEGFMIVNAESGGFDKIEQSAFDKAMDAKLSQPGFHKFEKMISGGYLGSVGLEIYKAAAQAGFFSREAAAAVAALQSLENMDFDNFCAQKEGPRPNPLDAVFASGADRAMARRLGIPVFERAAILTAIHLAAFILKTGGGTDPASPVCVNVDGSTYYKTRAIDFQGMVKRELDAMLAPRNISYAITGVDDAPMVGAAVAALLKG